MYDKFQIQVHGRVITVKLFTIRERLVINLYFPPYIHLETFYAKLFPRRLFFYMELRLAT